MPRCCHFVDERQEEGDARLGVEPRVIALPRALHVRALCIESHPDRRSVGVANTQGCENRALLMKRKYSFLKWY